MSSLYISLFKRIKEHKKLFFLTILLLSTISIVSDIGKALIFSHKNIVEKFFQSIEDVLPAIWAVGIIFSILFAILCNFYIPYLQFRLLHGKRAKELYSGTGNFCVYYTGIFLLANIIVSLIPFLISRYSPYHVVSVIATSLFFAFLNFYLYLFLVSYQDSMTSGREVRLKVQALFASNRKGFFTRLFSLLFPLYLIKYMYSYLIARGIRSVHFQFGSRFSFLTPPAKLPLEVLQSILVNTIIVFTVFVVYDFFSITNPIYEELEELRHRKPEEEKEETPEKE